MEIVSIIETLSPANKRSSSDGREQYLVNREEILQSRTNLVEVDLLRGGRRLPMLPEPEGDYFTIVSRGDRRPHADVFPWTIRQPLPTLPIPFTTVYDRALYQLSLNYSANLATPLSEADAEWISARP